MIKNLVTRFLNAFMAFQFKHPLYILGFVTLLTLVSAPRAIKLLTTVKTDLIHLLPEDRPSVELTGIIQEKFNRRSSLFLVIQSPHKESNIKAVKMIAEALSKDAEVDFVETEKRGFDFFDKNKLLLVELKDLYDLKEVIRKKIDKKKLGGLYIDLEEGEPSDLPELSDLTTRYQDKFSGSANDRYLLNKEGTVALVNIYPKDKSPSLKNYKDFVAWTERRITELDPKKIDPEITWGFAGAVKTRVEQYDALMRDLKVAGMISITAIFLIIYLYFMVYIKAPQRSFKQKVIALFVRILPTISVFIPMVMSTLLGFAFCSFFFEALNVVTSFLFSIIFGLGIDIGIHLMARYFHDRDEKLTVLQIHKNIILKTGKSCVTSVMTTVASFYILIINDFKGFSDFGWIAGNGLIVALLTYMIVFPCLIIIMDRYGLIPQKYIVHTEAEVKTQKQARRRHWFPFPRTLMAVFVALFLYGGYAVTHETFEWDFGKLKMMTANSLATRSKLREVTGRANSSAAVLINTETEARAIKKHYRQEAERDPKNTTIQFARSYYDMAPDDQQEKIAVLKEIDALLTPDVVNEAGEDERPLIDELKTAIAQTKAFSLIDVPQEVLDIFGKFEGDEQTALFVVPKPELELENGKYATRFFEDVHHVATLAKDYYAISDSIVFADVLRTLFSDSKIAITLSILVLLTLITFDFRKPREVLMIAFALACGIFSMFSLMTLFDIKLNFYNMIVIPAMIGMGEDNSVHVIHRYEELERRSIFDVLRTTGGASLLASLTTMLGFAGMCFINHPGLKSIGWMSVIGMGSCMITSLILLPIMCQIFLKPIKK